MNLIFIIVLIFYVSFHTQSYAQGNKSFCNYYQGINVKAKSLTSRYPYVNNEIKYYYLQFVVRSDSLGQPIGGINQSDIDYLMMNLNNYYNPKEFSFCSYSVQYDDNLINEEINLKHEISYVFVDDYPTLGQSGNPIHMDYTVVMDSSSIGYLVLAHEIAHNFQLLHTSDPGNLMNAGCCGTYLDSLQIATMHYYAAIKNFTPGATLYMAMLYAFGLEVCNNQWKPYNRFFNDKSGGCIPLTVAFKDCTSFYPTSWQWYFGDSSISTDRNPVHTYTTPGNYTVSLITSNSYGSDTLIKEKCILATDTVFNLPFHEDFENSLFPPAYWYIRDPDQILKWQDDTLARGNGNSLNAIMMDGYSGSFYPEGNHDSFILPPISFKYSINPYIIFNVSYPYYFIIDFDTLDLLISIDCGSTYSLLYSKTYDQFNIENNLGSYDTTARDFIPQKDIHWRTDTVSLSAYSGKDNVSFKFNFKQLTFGAYLHLDDILITADSIGNPPFASFLADTTLIYVNDTVHFTSTSTYTDSLQWLFAGGKPATSIDTTPAVVYDTTGIFAVTLVASNIFAKDTLTKTNYITVLPKPLPAAGFTADTTKICAGDTIQFTDSSINVTTWYWTFQGGNPSTAATQNASVVYADSGKYDVTLSIANAFGADTLVKAGYITVLKCDTIGINEHSTQNGFSISPNPVSNYAVIEYTLTSPEPLAIDIYNIIGKHVLSVIKTNNHPSGKYRLQMNTSALTSGIYFVSIRSGNNKAVRKLVKME